MQNISGVDGGVYGSVGGSDGVGGGESIGESQRLAMESNFSDPGSSVRSNPFVAISDVFDQRNISSNNDSK